MPADTYFANLIIPAVDPAKPSGQKNVEIPAGLLAPVRSVAGRTGDVALTAADIADLVQGTAAPQRWFHPGPVSNTGAYEMRWSFNEALTIPANLAGATISAPAPPANPAQYAFAATVAGTRTVLGTITISATGVVTLPTFAEVNVQSGDSADLAPVGTPDTTWADVAWAFMFQR
jgi:hypothetical protein